MRFIIILIALLFSSFLVNAQSKQFYEQIEFIPNPNGLMTINVSNIEKGINIRVFNLVGSEVKQFTSKDVYETFTKSFDWSDLPKGVYLVHIQSGSKVGIKRMTVQKKLK